MNANFSELKRRRGKNRERLRRDKEIRETQKETQKETETEKETETQNNGEKKEENRESKSSYFLSTKYFSIFIISVSFVFSHNKNIFNCHFDWFAVPV